MSRRLSAAVLLAASIVFFALALPAFAIPRNPVVSGTVYDAGGAPIPGATVVVSVEARSGTRPAAVALAGEKPGLVTTLTADGVGHWSYSDKPGTYVLDFSAAGFVPENRALTMEKEGVYSLDATLQPLAPPPTEGSISGAVVYGAARTPLANAFVWLYRQGDDGIWPPTSPGWGTPTLTVYTGADGTYTSGPLPFGNWKVRFFTVHTGSQWWQYVPTFDLATVLTLSEEAPDYAGIDGWYGMP